MRTPLALIAPVRFEDRTEVLCARCQTVLDRHQPDPEKTDRLLGTCGGCGAWFLIDAVVGVMYALPDVWLAPVALAGESGGHAASTSGRASGECA